MYTRTCLVQCIPRVQINKRPTYIEIGDIPHNTIFERFDAKLRGRISELLELQRPPNPHHDLKGNLERIRAVSDPRAGESWSPRRRVQQIWEKV